MTDKVLIVVSDNAANIKGAVVNELKWKHFGCYAHTINLIVEDALEPVRLLLSKIKGIVSHFKRSNLDTQKLIKYQTDSGVNNPKKLIQDICTRWNSTFYMVERLVSIEAAVRATIALIDKNIEPLSSDEWKICADLCRVLRPFEEVTRRISGEKYVSASQVIFLTTGLNEVCKKLIVKPFHVCALRVANDLKNGIEKRFDIIEKSKTIGTCSFLDPRFKTHVFRSESDANAIKEHVKTLATYEYSLMRRPNVSHYNEKETTSRQLSDPDGEDDDDDDLKVSSFLDKKLEKAQPPGK